MTSSDGFVDTWSFLDRRLDDVLRIPRLGARLRAMANPLSWFSHRDAGNGFGPGSPA